MKKISLILSLLLAGIFSAQVGIGNANPAVNLDARSATGNSAIAFGNTNQTAAAAGSGAMKYDNGQLYYSNGIIWVPMLEKVAGVFIPRVVAAGLKNTDQAITSNNNIPQIWAFQTISVNDGNWDSATNSYTVPSSGFYQISLGGDITVNAVSNSSSWAVFVYPNSGSTTTDNIYFVYTAQNLPAISQGVRGGSFTIYLNTGQVVKLGSAHCVGCGTRLYTVAPGAVFSITQLGN
jgi:hypothetical protein